VIIVPVVITMVLFIVTIFTILLPNIEKILKEQKIKMSQDMTQAALGVVEFYYNKHATGRMTKLKAQNTALENLRTLRYGKEQKDYFWINDLEPKMLMHPYRKDLEGTNVNDHVDADGTYLFRNFVKIAKEQGEGYTQYLWQQHDDSGSVLPKISYVKLFKPWGWILGTGVYIDDVEKDIVFITRRLVSICLVIIFIMIALLLFVVLKSSKIEKERFKETYLRKMSYCINRCLTFLPKEYYLLIK